MAERELSGKDLLEQLYRGLDTVPAAVEAEMDAQELRELAAAPSADASSAATAVAAEVPASRARLVRAPLMILCGIAVAGTIAAAVLRQSEIQPAPSAPVVAAPPPPSAPLQVADVAPPQPAVVLVNPFDATETFTFPPGTSKADARDQMATLLLKRAVERRAHRADLAAERSARYSGRGS